MIFELPISKKLYLSSTVPVVKGLFKAFPYLSDQTVISTLKKLFGENHYPSGQEFIEKAIMTLKRSLRSSNPNCRKKLIQNLVINHAIIGQKKRNHITKKIGFDTPMLLVISPTQRCTLSRDGCDAAEQSKFEDLRFDVFDRLITQAREMGIHFFVISGGEPFIYKGIFDLFEKHSDVFFQTYTSGTTLAMNDDAKKIARLGNVLPCINVEGFEKETDERLGKGHFKVILQAMENLRNVGVPFGFSATATRENNDMIVSDEMVDFYMDQGCALGYFFQYMPVGRAPDFDLVPTPQQRMYRYEKVQEHRSTKPILLADFWCDGPVAGGCLAGGRRYLHINHLGNVEPCVFAQAYDSNIYDKSLFDIITTSRLFASIRKRQPYSENLMRPCILIDVPEKWREVLEESGATLSYEKDDTVAADLDERMNHMAKDWKELADPVWYEKYHTAYEDQLNYTKRMQHKFEEISQQGQGEK